MLSASLSFTVLFPIGSILMKSLFVLSLFGNADTSASHKGGDAGGEQTAAAADEGEPADRERRCLLRGLIFSLIMVDTTINNFHNTNTTTTTTWTEAAAQLVR
jgi:hypothetical protein